MRCYLSASLIHFHSYVITTEVCLLQYLYHSGRGRNSFTQCERYRIAASEIIGLYIDVSILNGFQLVEYNNTDRLSCEQEDESGGISVSCVQLPVLFY